MAISRSQVSDNSIVIEGLTELRRDLGKLEPEAAKGIKESLKRGAELVADEARGNAPHGSTGQLAKRIRPQVTTKAAFVRDGAMKRSPAYPAGFNYPRLIEFAQGGRRAFLKPALASRSDDVEELMGKMLDRLADEHWK